MSAPVKPLVLLADDDAQIRAILAMKIAASDMEVIQAENGEDAIAKCRERKPDLIIMDVRMPIMSGTEAVMAIKEDPELKDIKIIFFSNFGEDDEVDSWIDQKYAKEMGAVDYIKKSEDLSKIVDKIKNMLAQ